VVGWPSRWRRRLLGFVTDRINAISNINHSRCQLSRQLTMLPGCHGPAAARRWLKQQGLTLISGDLKLGDSALRALAIPQRVHGFIEAPNGKRGPPQRS